MVCQDVCPVDNEFKNWIVDGETFSEEETHKILTGVPIENLPNAMITKLKKLYLVHDYALLQRNLRVLLDKKSFE
jgi:hypothetical protein